MPVGGETLIVGQYTVTWNAISMGLFEGEAGVPSIVQAPRSKAVNSTDKYGKTKIDSVHLGVDYTFEAVLMEYTKGLAAFWPFGTFGYLGTIGTLKYLLAKPLVLTVVAGTPAATASAPNSLTATKAILSDDHQGKLTYGTDVRTVPLKMDLLPFLDGSQLATCFTMT